ncbi:MAG: TonB-dependent receptor [Cyanobacteria bacterium J06634_5]
MSKTTQKKCLHSVTAGVLMTTLEVTLGASGAKATDSVLEPTVSESSEKPQQLHARDRSEEFELEASWRIPNPGDRRFRMTATEENAPVADTAQSNFPFISVESFSQPPSSAEALSSLEIPSLLAIAPNVNEQESADTLSTLLAFITQEAEAEANADTAATLLALVAELEARGEASDEASDEAGDEASDEDAQTTAMLLALISDLQAGNNEAAKRAATFLALRSPTPDSSLNNKPAEPWLAFLTTASEDDEDDPLREPWIAIAVDDSDEETTQETQKKAPWLARITSAEEDPATVGDTLLSINLSQPDVPKRSSAWISLTPLDLLAPNSSNSPEVAANPVANRRTTEAYDVRTLNQVAITPAGLANRNEVAVSVNSSQVEFLSPEPGAFLDFPATSVVLQFPVGAKIALLANGQVVDSGLVGRTETDPKTQLRTQSWYGVPLASGENLLEIISTETGEVLQRLPLTVRGQPDELILLSARAIPADGRSTASIRGQLVDEFGNLSRWDSVATLQASDGRFLGADYKPDLPGFQVEVLRGEFVAELQSSLESHLVQIQASANGYEAFGQLQFETPQRPSLLSGIVDVRLGARGTNFYDSYREFLPLDGDNSYGFDVDTAIFATGNLGEWLYTGAYNSDRALNENCRGESSLFRTADGNCNVYATYGDDSYSDVVTPSLDSVYLRFERNSPSATSGVDYAMWGDFNTEEFSTAAQLFTATNRQLHGFKANYNFGNLAVTGLYANNVEGFQRDTLSPDGTSGFYFTSQRDLVPGSESVYLELEELERPGTVLDRVRLIRGLDYEVDYDRGTLLFSDPVARTSVDEFGQLLIRRIVTTYQHESGGDTNILAGRGQYNLNQQQNQASWVGASYFAEDQGNRDFTLYGADAQISLDQSTKVTAEVARSSSRFDTVDEITGTAYRLEVDSDLGDFLTGRAYLRSTDAGFANAATTSFVPGQTRYGAQLSGRLGKNTSLRARFDQENNFGTAPQVVTDLDDLLSAETAPTETIPTGRLLDNSLTTYSLGASQRWGKTTAEIDWIHRDRTDRLSDTSTVTSDQLRTRLSTPLSDTLSLVAQNELNLSSDVDPVYPSRTLLGINWEAMPGITVGVNQIFYGGGGNRRGNATSIDVTGEHTFESDTTVRGRFSTIDGRQVGGTIGLEQGIKLAPGLDLDLGYEKVFSTFGNSTAASTQFAQPFATGPQASALGLSGGESYSVGLSYTDNPDFQASTRFEHRSSAQSSNTVFNASILGRITPELTLLGDYRMANTANQRITGLGRTSLLKLGMAYRDPDNDRFNALLRYEHRMNPNSIPTNASLGSSTETQEHLFSAEAIYAPNWRWELYGKYALRNSRTDISGAGSGFSSSTTAQLAQARATYRLGYRWDVVGEARWLGGNGYGETGYSVETGYYPLPDLRLLAGYSGGATDYDFGENRSAGGFYMGATAKLGGLLNGFGTQPNDPYQQEPSAVEASEDRLEPMVESLSNPQFSNSSSASDVMTSPDSDRLAAPTL